MILARLQTNVHETLTDSQIISVIRLLERLPFNLSAEEKARVLVPNVEGRMMKVVQLYLNDTGVSIDPQDLTRRGRSIAHNIVSERIAQNLGIEPLVNLYSDFVSGYMGESFISSIRNTIVDYSEAQMLTEMLANAVDAGAKRFLVVIDNMPQSTSHLISSKLVKFQECPAVLVYNDAQFTELDFRGLCETGEGSKKNNLYSIGQFGRGALTMFHLTEVRAPFRVQRKVWVISTIYSFQHWCLRIPSCLSIPLRSIFAIFLGMQITSAFRWKCSSTSHCYLSQ